jgi:hypothetical protein
MKTATTWITEQIEWLKTQEDYNTPESIYQEIEFILHRAKGLEKAHILLAFTEGQTDILTYGAQSATLGVNYYDKTYNQ